MDNKFPEIEMAVSSLGGPTSVARLRGLTPWAVSKWITDGMPAKQVLWLSEQTGWKYTPHKLAPELYPHPDDGLPEEHRMAETSSHGTGSEAAKRMSA